VERLLDPRTSDAMIPFITGKAATVRCARRVAHEAIFNVNDGSFRCPNSQQGFSPFHDVDTGLAWAMCGFA